MRRAPLFALFIAIFTLFSRVEDAAAKKDDFKIQGRLGLGADVAEDDTKETFEMRLGVKTKRKKGLKAYVEIRADEGSRDVGINDVFLDYRNKEKTSRFRAGRGKKIMGWEYEYSTSDRLTIHRSLGYRYLSERAIVGRDYFLGYEYSARREDDSEGEEGAAPGSVVDGAVGDGAEPAEEKTRPRESDLDSALDDPRGMIDSAEKYTLGAAFHYDESKDLSLILSALASPSPHWRAGLWAIVQRTRNPWNAFDTFGAMASALFQSGPHRAALESFYGGDPYRTEVAKFFGGDSGSRIQTQTLKAEYGAYFGAWNPYASMSVVWKDVKNRGDRTWEPVVGARFFFAEALSFAVEAARTKSSSGHDPTTEAYEEDSFATMGRYYF